jgi:transposase
LGVSRTTINSGIADLETSDPSIVSNSHEKQRKKGGGRKKSITDEVWKKIETFVMPHTRGDPESPLKWVSKSLRNIETALKSIGISVSHRIIGNALKAQGFSLQSNRKRLEGNSHPDTCTT